MGILKDILSSPRQQDAFRAIDSQAWLSSYKKCVKTMWERKHPTMKIVYSILTEEDKYSYVDCSNSMIELFYNKNKREENDRFNKLRENFILKMFNTNLIDVDPRFSKLKDQFVKIFQKNLPKKIIYDKFVLERKAGRKNNYDFLVLVQKKLFTQHSIKIEFKYGKSIFDYPQFISIYLNNQNFKLIKNDLSYVDYWYKYFLPKYLSCTYLEGSIPPYTEYLRSLNSTTYKTELQKKIYDIMKNDPLTKRKLYAIVDRSIEQYLSMLTLTDIDFEIIENMIHKQIDKIFIFCESGKLTWYSFDKFIINRNKYKINKNTLLVYSNDNKFVIKFLLRWKNYKGLSGPAWQVGIKKMI